MRIAIVTSEDYFFAANIFFELKKSFSDISFIDVKGEKKIGLWKKIKLSFLLGPYAVLKIFIKSFLNRHHMRLTKSILAANKLSLIEELTQASYDYIFLVNYPWKIKNIPDFPIFNCHPSLLPDFRGLTPIPHALLLGWCNTKHDSIGLTIHAIDEQFDQGIAYYQNKYSVSCFKSISSAYDLIYADFVTGIKAIVHGNSSPNVLQPGQYFREISLKKCLKLKCIELFKSDFIYFLINGGVIGILSWALQLFFYYSMDSLDISNAYRITLSIWLSFIIALLVNYISQKKIVFRRSGSFVRFSLSTSFLILCVSILSAVMFSSIESISLKYAEILAYPLSALILSPVAYYLKSKFVFKNPVN